MLNLHSIFDVLPKVDIYPTEDFADRLNFRVTVYLLAFFALITGSQQHFGNPIQCMAPPESPESWVNYYHDYCYIQDKLRIFDMSIYKSVVYETRQRAGADFTPIGRFLKENPSKYWSPRVMYYQWVPYVLVLQAIFFLIPKFFWKLVGSHWCHGVDLETAIIEAKKIRTLVGEDRRTALINLAKFIRDILKSGHKRPIFGSSMASICYVITKWLEVVNGFGQFHMLSRFVGQSDYFWGYHLLIAVLKGSDDPNTGVFPRIVLCDVTRFALANLHQEHMQCVLMLNFINEKIYTFLWFWIVFIISVSMFSAMKQTMALLLPVYRGHIAENFLPTPNVLFSSAAAQYGIRPAPANNQALVDFFVHEVLRCDGVLLLSFINGNVGGLVTHDLAHQLWKITVQPIEIGNGCGSTSIECLDKKTSPTLFWPKFSKLRRTKKKLEISSSCFETEKNYMAKNVETQLPTAPLESSPMMSDSATTQAFGDSTCPIESLYEWPSREHHPGRIQDGPGVTLFENRYHDT